MEPCMCGAEDCPRCFGFAVGLDEMLRRPGIVVDVPDIEIDFFFVKHPLTSDEFDAMADDEPCCYCGGPVEREKCLDHECEGS